MISENTRHQVLGTLENVLPSSEKQTSRYKLLGESSEERNKHNQKLENMAYIWVCLVKYVIDFWRMEGKNCCPYTQRETKR